MLYLRCTTWCFDECIHCEIITTIKLINVSITSHRCVCVWQEHLTSTLLAISSIHTVLLPIVSMCTLDFQNLFILYHWNFVNLDQHLPLPQTLVATILLSASLVLTNLYSTYRCDLPYFNPLRKRESRETGVALQHSVNSDQISDACVGNGLSPNLSLLEEN